MQTRRPRLSLAVALVALMLIGWWTVVETRLLMVPRTDGPIEGFSGNRTVSVARMAHGEWLDWAAPSLVNSSSDPAVITGVTLLRGGGSSHALETDGFFVIGRDLSFGGGDADAPSHAEDWGYEPVPAIGFELPAMPGDNDGLAYTLIARVSMGAVDEGSFEKVEVDYRWHGDDYKATFNHALLLCLPHRQRPEGAGDPCRDAPFDS